MKVRAQLLLASVFAAGTLLSALPAAAADDYPNRASTIVVHLAAGGGLDGVARIVADYISQDLGQPFVVENRTGGGGGIGTLYVARSEPDGYTLQLGNASTHAVLPAMRPDIGYDVEKDFVCVSYLGDSTGLVVVPATLPVNTFAEFVELAKSKPGDLNYASGSTGAGSSQLLQGQLLQREAGIELRHIPYQGAAPALQAVVAGDVSFFIAGAASAMGHIKAGRLKVLAATGNERFPLLPDVPTLNELDIPGFEVGPWYALFAPTGVQESVVKKLEGAVLKAMADPDVIAKLEGIGVNSAATSSEECKTIVADQIELWTKMNNELGEK